MLKANVRQGRDRRYGFDYYYVMPSPGRYEWQWFWDSCFHAIALSKLDLEMAKMELRTLTATQRRDGFIGHMNFWGEFGALYAALSFQSSFAEWRNLRSSMIQPPILPQAIECVFEQSGDEAFLAELLPKAALFYKWLSRNRDIDGEGLIWILSPFESGLDNNSAYDAVMGIRQATRQRWNWANHRHDVINMLVHRWNIHSATERGNRVMADPFVNAVFADGWRTLSRLHRATGRQTEASESLAMSERIADALNRRCWDEEKGLYRLLSPILTDEHYTNAPVTVNSLFPALLPETPPERQAWVIEGYLLDESKFWRNLPVPSVAADEPSYSPDDEGMIWRGQSSMGMNWLITRGLVAIERCSVAKQIARKSKEAASEQFSEFYSPETGKGLRGTQFGWATVVVNMCD